MFVTAVVGQLYHFFVTVNSGAKKGRIAAAGGLIVNTSRAFIGSVLSGHSQSPTLLLTFSKTILTELHLSEY